MISDIAIAIGIEKIKNLCINKKRAKIPIKLLKAEIWAKTFSLPKIGIHWFPQMYAITVNGKRNPNAFKYFSATKKLAPSKILIMLLEKNQMINKKEKPITDKITL